LAKARAVVIEAPHRVTLKQFDLPKIGSQEALLRVEMVSVCGSDPSLYVGKEVLGTRYPVIPGHEMVGFIEEIGPEAERAYGVTVGDRVTVEPYILCKQCRYCLTGHYQLCTNMRCYGMNLSCADPPHLWGAYSEYMYIAPNSKLHKVAPNVPAKAACLSSVIGNGVRWIITKARVRPGESVVILGPGTQGLASVVAAKEAGAYPIVVTGLEHDTARLALARDLGADRTVNVEEEDLLAVVAEVTGGEMADVVVECTGHPAAAQQGVDVLHPLGRLVLVGMSGGREVPLRTDLVIRKELQVLGGLGQAWDVELAMKIINSGKYPLERIVTHVFPLDRAEEALRMAKEVPPGFIKAAIQPWSSGKVNL